MDKTFNVILKDLRNSKGITQSQMAALLNITDRAYQYYESGERFPSLEVMKRIADILKISELDLFPYHIDYEYDSTEMVYFFYNDSIIVRLENLAKELNVDAHFLMTYIFESFFNRYSRK